MDFVKGDYLRVMTVQTVGGVQPRYDHEGKVMYKETHLPLTAKKHIEKRNRELPDHLKMKIDVVSSEPVGPANAEPGQKTIPGVKRFQRAGSNDLNQW